MNEPFGGTEDLAELAPGRGYTESTEVPDWIVLAASSPAVKLYVVLRMRLNRKRGRKVWPGRANLAVALDVKKTDTVSVYLKELESIGGIDITRTNTVPSYNVYRINHAPPDGYAGFQVMEEWDRDRDNRERADAIRTYEKDKRDRAKAKSQAAKTPASAKQQVGADTPSNGYLDQPAKTASPDTRSNGYLDTPSNGYLDTCSNGSKPLGLTKVLEITVSSTSSSSTRNAETEDQKTEDHISPKIENQETNTPIDDRPETPDDVKDKAFWPELTAWERTLLEECLTLAGARWSASSLRKVLGSRTIRGLTDCDPELVRRAFRIGAASREGITVPMRMWHVAECPHWRTAEGQLEAERDPEINQDSAGTATPSQDTQTRPVAAPSPSQESQDTDQTQLSKDEARALASRLIAEGAAKRAGKTPAARSHRETMDELDKIIQEESGVKS